MATKSDISDTFNESATMRAMVLTGHGGFEKLIWREDWPRPHIGKGEILLKVLACGLNNTDVNTRTGWYSAAVSAPITGQVDSDSAPELGAWGDKAVAFPRIQGADVVGCIAAVGDGVSPDLIGKRAVIDTWLRDWSAPMDLTRCGYFGSECDGGFAEYTKADMHQIHPIESDLSDAEIATFPTSYATAENMLRRANVGQGDTVLITGASGGVGGALVQLANYHGARTIAMASEQKHAQVAQLCPDRILPRNPANLAEALKGEEVSVVADIVGGPLWPALIKVLVQGGRYCCAGAIGGAVVDFDLRDFYLKDISFFGATITPPGLFADLITYIEKGAIKPVLADCYPLRHLHDAQKAFIEKAHSGNIVVVP